MADIRNRLLNQENSEEQQSNQDDNTTETSGEYQPPKVPTPLHLTGSTPNLVQLETSSETPGGSILKATMNIKIPSSTKFEFRGNLAGATFSGSLTKEKNETPEFLKKPEITLPLKDNFESVNSTQFSSQIEGAQTTVQGNSNSQPGEAITSIPSLNSNKQSVQTDEHDSALFNEHSQPGAPRSSEGRPYQIDFISPDNRFQGEARPSHTEENRQVVEIKSQEHEIPANESKQPLFKAEDAFDLAKDELEKDDYVLMHDAIVLNKDPSFPYYTLEPNTHVLDEEAYDEIKLEAGSPYAELFNRVLSDLLAPASQKYHEATDYIKKTIEHFNQTIEPYIPVFKAKLSPKEANEQEKFNKPFKKLNSDINKIKQMYGSLEPTKIAEADILLLSIQAEFQKNLETVDYPNRKEILAALQTMLLKIPGAKQFYKKSAELRLEALEKAPQEFHKILQKQAEELQKLANELTEKAQKYLDQEPVKDTPENQADRERLLKDADDGLSDTSPSLNDSKQNLLEPESKMDLSSQLDAESWEVVKHNPEKMQQKINSLNKPFEETHKKLAQQLLQLGKKRGQQAQQVLAKLNPTLTVEAEAPIGQPENKAQVHDHPSDQCTCADDYASIIKRIRPEIKDHEFKIKGSDNKISIEWNLDDKNVLPPTMSELNNAVKPWCAKCIRDGLLVVLNPDTAVTEYSIPEAKSRKWNYAFAGFSSIFTAIFAFMGPSGGKQPNQLVEAWNAMSPSEKALAIIYGGSSETINTFVTADFSTSAKKAVTTFWDALKNIKQAPGKAFGNIGELILGGFSALAALALGIDSLKWLAPAMSGKFTDAEEVAEGISILGGAVNFFVTFVSRYIGVIKCFDLIFKKFDKDTQTQERLLGLLSLVDVEVVENYFQDKKLTDENILAFFQYLEKTSKKENVFRDKNWRDHTKQFLEMCYSFVAVTSSLTAWGVFGQKAINAMALISDIKSLPNWAQGMISSLPGLPSAALYLNSWFRFLFNMKQQVSYIANESTSPIKDSAVLVGKLGMATASSFSVLTMARGVNKQKDGYVYEIVSDPTITEPAARAAQLGAVVVNGNSLLHPGAELGQYNPINVKKTFGKKNPTLPELQRHIAVEGLAGPTLRKARTLFVRQKDIGKVSSAPDLLRNQSVVKFGS